MNAAKFVDGSKIDKSKGTVLDFGQDDEIVPENLPDADQILDTVIKILEFINNEELKKLRLENEEAFVSTLENKFEDFALKYYGVFRMVISGKDISPLIEMLDIIKKMKTGVMTVERGEQQVGTRLKKFLPDGIEEKLQKETIQNMKKANKK